MQHVATREAKCSVLPPRKLPGGLSACLSACMLADENNVPLVACDGGVSATFFARWSCAVNG